MGLAAKIDTTFGSERRDSLRNIDSALKLHEFRALYVLHFEAAFLEVSEGVCVVPALCVYAASVFALLNI